MVNNNMRAIMLYSMAVVQVCIVCYIGYKVIIIGSKLDNLMHSNERFAMCADVDWNKTINGVYFNNEDYYCVWAKGRDPLKVSKTEAHEYCHYLIDNEYCYDDNLNVSCKEHFCGHNI